MPDVVERMTGEGEGYQQARRAFNVLLSSYGNAMYYASRLVGGVHVRRDHKGDPNARPPFEVVDAKKQREAVQLLQEHILGPEALQFSPKVYNFLAPPFWSHWGSEPLSRTDYPVQDILLGCQERVLSQLLSPATLERLTDSELKLSADEDAFTAAELLGRLSGMVFSETEKLQAGDFTNRKPAINSLRRNLQRRYVQRLADLALGGSPAPEDCQSIAGVELESLEARIKQVLAGNAKLDPYTRAHLHDTAATIRKVLEARIDRRP